MKPKIFTTMPGYTRDLLLRDVIAGVTVAMVALPLSLAIAIASGADPAKGLVTAIVGGFLFHFWVAAGCRSEARQALSLSLSSA